MGKKVENSIKEKVISYYLENKDCSIGQVAEKFGYCKQTIGRFLKNAGIEVDPGRSIRGKSAPHLRGFPAWNKGLKKISDSRVAGFAKTRSQKQEVISGGYRKIWSDELQKSVWEHHLVWFRNTGVWPDFQKNEQIHHIDGDKLNNSVDNLLLVTVAEHTELHKKYESIVFELIKLGFVSFDKTSRNLETDKLWKILKG